MKKIRIPIITPIFALAFLYIDFSLYTLIIFLSALLHECGHLIFMSAFGVGIEKIIILPVGARIIEKQSLISYGKEIIISAGGCIFNLLIFLLFYKSFPVFACTNLFFFTLNILPIYSLDGGRIVRLISTMRYNPEKAERTVHRVSFVFSVILWVFGVYIMLCLKGNLSLFALSLFLITNELVVIK